MPVAEGSVAAVTRDDRQRRARLVSLFELSVGLVFGGNQRCVHQSPAGLFGCGPHDPAVVGVEVAFMLTSAALRGSAWGIRSFELGPNSGPPAARRAEALAAGDRE